MLGKLVVGALAAGAISVPLAGVAAAQPHHHHGSHSGAGAVGGTTVSGPASAGVGRTTTLRAQSNGAGGLLGRVGNPNGTTTTTTTTSSTPAQVLGPLRQQARSAGTSLPHYLRAMTPPVKSPGQLVRGIARNNFPKTSSTSPGSTSATRSAGASGSLGTHAR